jgi:hypothetical protein
VVYAKTAKKEPCRQKPLEETMSYPDRETPNLQNLPPPPAEGFVREAFVQEVAGAVGAGASLKGNYEALEDGLVSQFKLDSEQKGNRIWCCDKENWEFGGHVTLGKLWTSVFICLGCRKVAIVLLLKEAFADEVGYGLALFGKANEEGKLEFEPYHHAVKVSQGALEPIATSDIAAAILPVLKKHMDNELGLELLQLASRRSLKFSDFHSSPLDGLKTECKEPKCKGIVIIARDPDTLELNTDLIYCIKCGKKYVLDAQGLKGRELEEKLYGS